jgi:hypothetical protein
MKKFIHWAWLAVILGLLTAGLFFGCSSGDDDDDDSGDDDTADDDTADDDTAGDDDTGDDDTGDDDDDDDDNDDNDDNNDDNDNDDNDDLTPPSAAVIVRLSDFLSGNLIVGATCELVRNGDGASFDPPLTDTSDAAGNCTFNTYEKGELFSMKVTYAGYVDSYFFQYDTDSTWYFYLVSNVTRTGIFLLLGLSQDVSKGAIVGGVKWDLNSHTSEDIGCAEVTSSSGDTVYYMDDTGMPSTSRTSTNPNDGYFLSLLVDPGSYTVSADVDGAVEEQAVPRVFANTLTYVNIMYPESEYATNPTPVGCTK